MKEFDFKMLESVIQSLPEQVAKRKEKQRTAYIYIEFVLCIQPTHATYSTLNTSQLQGGSHSAAPQEVTLGSSGLLTGTPEFQGR